MSSDSVELRWTASRDDFLLLGYRVYRDGSRIGSTPRTTYTDTGLSPGTTYEYRVSAFDWIGNESAKSTTLFVATSDGSAPTAPANLQGTAVSTSRIDLAWTASTDNVGVAGYRVYRDGGLIGTTTGTSFSDTGLAEYTTYVYRIVAYDAGGNESVPSSPLTATTVDGTPPTVPSNLQGAAASTTRIDLTWTASTDNAGVAGYRIYRNGTAVGTTASTSYSDTGLSEATSYSYAVAAYDAEGNESAQCGALAVYTADATAPSVPSNLQGTAISTSQINLTWTASSDNLGVAGYRVYRNGSLVASPASTNWSDTGLAEATSYSYRVEAYDAAGNASAQCGAVAVSTLDATAPSVPSNLQGAAASTSQINLTWTASTDNVGVTGYKVFRNGSQVGMTASTSFSDTGLAEATSYSYRVLAYDAGGNESAQCGAVAVSTADATAPSVPSNLQGTGASASQINLTWTASTDNVGVTGYRVYRNGSQVGTTASTSFSDTGLAEATSYSYTVAAYDAAGNASAQCGAAAVSTLDATAPSVPANLQAAVVSTSRIDLSWTASTDNVGVAGYRVYRDGSLVASPAGTSYSDTGLAAGTTYGYRVAAYDAAGNTSAQCAAVNATTQSGTWGGTVLIGTASTDRGHGIAVDSGGNIYVAGYTAGHLDGEVNANPGTNDIFLTKYDASGARQWTRLSGTAGEDEAGWSAVAVDASGNVYVTGWTAGDLDGETNAGGSDIFLMKYNSSGAKQWTRLLGTTAEDAGWGVAVDGSGNIYVSGTTRGNLDGETHSGGTYDTFLAKYNSSGTRQWTRLLGNGTETYAYTVAVDGSGNALVAGHTRGTFDSESNAGMTDIYVAKYNSSGTRQWVRMLGSARFDYCYGVATDSSGNVYVGGSAYGDFDGYANNDATWMSEDIFVAKFNSSGTKQWSVFHGGAGNDVASGLAVDSSGNAYVFGNTDAALDGFTPAGSHDLILIKYDTSGTRQWTRMLGTTAGDCARSVAVDTSGNTYMTGDTSGNLDGATNSGGTDGFIVKYDTNGNLQ
ncbi:MAG: SBBP repeat-containing protein [Syntrophobacterales bacterium]|nr:SBBP repeat-containing protein [Syntrophobacterales bacterium]